MELFYGDNDRWCKILYKYATFTVLLLPRRPNNDRISLDWYSYEIYRPPGRNFGALIPVFSIKYIHFHWLFIGKIYSILINFVPKPSLHIAFNTRNHTLACIYSDCILRVHMYTIWRGIEAKLPIYDMIFYMRNIKRKRGKTRHYLP